MKIVLLLVVWLVYAAPFLSAQQLTCTPTVPSDTCKQAQIVALRLPGDHEKVVIADPQAFSKEKESLMDTLPGGIKAWNVSKIVLDPDDDDIIFEREGETCPSRIVISTDRFRPAIVDTKNSSVKYVQGLDLKTLFATANFVRAFIQGCNLGVATYLQDQMSKLNAR